jgi:hypothetical protein
VSLLIHKAAHMDGFVEIVVVLPQLGVVQGFSNSEMTKRPASEMATVNVTVKWGKESYEVDAHLGESPLVFKSQLFALTGVPPDRQKVMIKGGLLKDDDWGKATPKVSRKLPRQDWAQQIKGMRAV